MELSCKCKEQTIQLCNDALSACERIIPRDVAEEIRRYINDYNEWGIGVELLVDVLTEEGKKITDKQFHSIMAAIQSMGIDESSRVNQLETLMSDKKLTEKQAYLSMYSFLEEYYELTNLDEIGSLLGSMSLLQDGGTADPAILKEWEKAVKRVLEGKVDGGLSIDSKQTHNKAN